MKYISLSVRKAYLIAQHDIRKIHLKPNRKRPSIPQYEDGDYKMISPAVTEIEEYAFSEARDEEFLC